MLSRTLETRSAHQTLASEIEILDECDRLLGGMLLHQIMILNTEVNDLTP